MEVITITPEKTKYKIFKDKDYQINNVIFIQNKNNIILNVSVNSIDTDNEGVEVYPHKAVGFDVAGTVYIPKANIDRILEMSS